MADSPEPPARHDREVVVSKWARRKSGFLGAQGQEWLSGLAGLIADLEGRWSITVGEPMAGGTSSYVAQVRTDDGGAAVLKIAIPGLDFAQQVRTLVQAQGRAYVRVLAADVGRSAVLLEALGTPLDRLGWSPVRQIPILCATLRQAWRVPLPDALTSVQAQAKARDLAQMVATLWENLGRPCSERVVTCALEVAQRRADATDLDRVVVVHGDPHPGNALQVHRSRSGAESGFVFVDPDGFVADPAYDLGVVLRDWCPELLAGNAPGLAREYCRLLAGHSGIAEQAIWEWGFLERVSTGLYVLQFGAEGAARPFLATAELLV
jgi:streptomycin 6-kinase